MTENTNKYFETRFTEDSKRSVLWNSLYKYYFHKLIKPADCVLELGCGYGYFINAVRSRRRIALDAWEDFPKFLEPDIEPHIGPVADLSFLDDSSVDVVFASNLFEHITQADFALVLSQLRRKLTSSGRLIILQPNYRFAYKEYFDDYTHITVYSDISICDFLAANQFEVVTCQPRFTPLTVKSRLKVSPLLIKLYLLSPIKPLGKQMLIVCRPKLPPLR